MDTLSYEIWDVPLDQEITNEGDYYQDPSLPDDQITYLYTALPVDQSLPSNIDAQLVQQLYLYSDADGDYYDGEEDHDPWDPNDHHCYDYTPTGIPYEVICDECTTCTPGGGTRMRSKKRNFIKEATEYLKSIGINPKDLYAEAMKISGNPDELVADDATTRKNPANSMAERRYRPGGHLAVHDNDANRDVDLRDVTVKTRRFFNLHTAKTNGVGNFTISGTYNKKATVLVKFKNDYATIRGINGKLKIWQYVFPVKRNLGSFERTDMENITTIFNTDFVDNSNATMQWVAATALNNVWQMRAYCNANNIPGPPANLTIWVSSAVTQFASTPMLSRVTDHNLIRQALEQYLSGWSNILDLTSIMQSLVPDITLRYGSGGHAVPILSRQINNNFFHEQAHSIHYIFVGPIYWTQEIAYTVIHNGYGNKTDAGAGRVAVVEAWGFYIGNLYNSQFYATLNAAQISSDERQQLEDQIPNDNVSYTSSGTSSQGWIPAGLLYDLTDFGENTSLTTVTDNVFSYSVQNVFSGYAFGSAANVQDFKTNLLLYNGNLQATPVNQLVTSYHY